MLKCMILDRDIPALNAFVEYLEQMNAALADVRQLVKRKETPIFVREGNKIIRLKEDEILFIEGFGDYAKVGMAELFLRQQLGEDRLEDKVLFFGDSPNDEPMFARFPLTVGVANIRPFAESLSHLPAFVTEGEGGFGFAEAAKLLTRLKKG